MQVLAEDYPFTLSDRERRVKGSSFEIIGGLAVFLKKDFKILDPFLKQ